MRRVLSVLVAGGLLAAAAPASAAIEGVTLRQLNDAYANETTSFVADVTGAAQGLVEYDWGLECDATGPFDWTTNTFSGGFDRTFTTVGRHGVCVRAHDDGNAVTDAVAFDVASRGNHAPVPHLTVTPNPAPVGGEVTFDATSSEDVDGDNLRFQFDIDGEPGYELDAGATRKVTQTYVGPVAFKAGVQVTDASGAKASATVNVVVGDPSPLKVGIAVRRQSLRAAKSQGLQIKVTTSDKAKLKVQVRLADGSLLGSAKGAAKKGARLLRPRLRGLPSGPARVVVLVTATSAAHATVVKTKRLTLR